MGIAVSDWNLARQVSLRGGMGVVSGTAIDSVLARRLQDGDPHGHTRRALATFPNQAMVARVMERYFIEGGKAKDVAYAAVPKMRLDQAAPQQELSILASYVQVGTSGGVVTTGYSSGSTRAGWSATSTAGFVIAVQAAAGAFSGAMTVANLSGNA